MKHLNVMAAVALFLIGATSTFAGSNGVDAVAAATMNNSCKISSATPTETSVTLVWTGGHSGGTMVCTVTPTGGSPLAPRNVTSGERSAKSLVFTGLAAGTAYSIQIICSQSGETPYGASKTFTTTAATGIRGAVLSAVSQFCAVYSNSALRLSIPVPSLDGYSVSLFNARGVRVEELTLSGSATSISLPVAGLSSGVYVVRVTNGARDFTQSLQIGQ